jgi:hypothetical protein
MDGAGTYLSPDIIFESPLARVGGKTKVSKAMAEFTQVVTGITLLAAIGDSLKRW